MMRLVYAGCERVRLLTSVTLIAHGPAWLPNASVSSSAGSLAAFMAEQRPDIIQVISQNVRDGHISHHQRVSGKNTPFKEIHQSRRAMIRGTPSLGEFPLWSTDVVYIIGSRNNFSRCPDRIWRAEPKGEKAGDY